jgi:hypothetical protein
MSAKVLLVSVVKKRAVFALLLFLLGSLSIFTSGTVFTSLQFVSLVKANPVPYPSTPNTDLPTLTVQTPQNYSDIYAENLLILNFSVTKPDSWNHYHLGIPAIGDYQVYVYLDNNLLDTLLDYPRPYDQMSKDYSVVLNGLTSEWHTIQIDVRARTFYKITKAAEKPLEHIMNTSATIHFNIITENKTIFPTVDETVTIPEFQPWMILPLIATATLLVTVIRRKRL